MRIAFIAPNKIRNEPIRGQGRSNRMYLLTGGEHLRELAFSPTVEDRERFYLTIDRPTQHIEAGVMPIAVGIKGAGNTQGDIKYNTN